MREARVVAEARCLGAGGGTRQIHKITSEWDSRKGLRGSSGARSREVANLLEVGYE